MWYNVITIFTHHIKCKHKRVCQDRPVQKTNENKLDQQLYLDLSKWSTIQIWNKQENTASIRQIYISVVSILHQSMHNLVTRKWMSSTSDLQGNMQRR